MRWALLVSVLAGLALAVGVPDAAAPVAVTDEKLHVLPCTHLWAEAANPRGQHLWRCSITFEWQQLAAFLAVVPGDPP